MNKKTCNKDELCSAIEEVIKEKPKEVSEVIKRQKRKKEEDEEMFTTDIGEDD